MNIKNIAIKATKDFCSEHDIEQTFDNVQTFCEGESVPIVLYNGVDLEQLVKELMGNDSTLTNDEAWNLAYRQAEK
ncbi:MAG: hypothetical protein O7D95_02950 [Betaproteobacteria bacterium]|nr:hypothetical protein [Betaproteobacteria bacterium]